ncbi:hypothetical protein D9R21_04830, partial [Spiroplasma endosymbiont of Megaselia nigra]
MKNILSIFWTITLIGTSTTSLFSCNTLKYNEKQLKELKEKHNINTNDGILEWIAPPEKPFNNVDNKWYYVVWRGEEKNNWRIINFNYNFNNTKKI